MRHSQLEGLSVGDDHPQYVLKASNGSASGSLPPGSLGGNMLVWDATLSKWVETSDVRYEVTGPYLYLISALIAGSSECTGNWLIHGSSGIKLEITEAGPGARRFAVDTANDRVELLAGQVVKRTAVSSTPYAVVASDYYLAVDTTAAITVNLPAANAIAGRVLIIKDATGTGAGTNAITITPAGSDTTEVGSIGSDNGFVMLVSDGISNWEAAVL